MVKSLSKDKFLKQVRRLSKVKRRRLLLNLKEELKDRKQFLVAIKKEIKRSSKESGIRSELRKGPIPFPLIMKVLLKRIEKKVVILSQKIRIIQKLKN